MILLTVYIKNILRKLGFLLLLLQLVIVFGSLMFAQEKVGTTSFQFLKVKPDAWSASMGNAITSVVNNSDAVFTNPAGLTYIGKSDVSFSYYNYFYGVKTSAFSAAYNKPGFGVLGVQGLFTSYGEMDVTTVEAMEMGDDGFNHGLTGETFSPGHSIIGLTFARQQTDKFCFGITAKYVRENADIIYTDTDGAETDMDQSAFLFDTGINYYTGYRSIRVSMVLSHFGKNITYVEKDYPVPQLLVIGTSFYVLSPEEGLITNQQNPVSLLMSFDLVAPRDYDQQYNIGMEFSMLDFLFLRAGYKINYDTENWSAGGGVKYNRFRFDYSFTNYNDYLAPVHRFTLGLRIDN